MKTAAAAGALALALLANPIVAAQAAAADVSEALADCLYQHSTSADKQVFLQWAYVTLGKTAAAQKIQKIPDASIRSVEGQAQKTLTNLVLGKCSQPAMKVLMKDPKNGLQNTLNSLAQKLVEAEIRRRASPVLALTITDLIRR
ncbi:MAG: hypothetical protein J6K46_00375 [Sutterella sp.]|nr:hypothetical protein [Sutterella sp.]